MLSIYKDRWNVLDSWFLLSYVPLADTAEYFQPLQVSRCPTIFFSGVWVCLLWVSYHIYAVPLPKPSLHISSDTMQNTWDNSIPVQYLNKLDKEGKASTP
jgi:hypothetical protein